EVHTSGVLLFYGSAFPDIQGDPHHRTEQPAATGQQLKHIPDHVIPVEVAHRQKNGEACQQILALSAFHERLHQEQHQKDRQQADQTHGVCPGQELTLPFIQALVFLPAFGQDGFFIRLVHPVTSTVITSFIGILIIAQPSVLVNRFCKVLLAVSSVRRISPGSSAGCGRCSCPPRQNKNPRGSHLRGFVCEKPASTYFHRPCPANYLRHK